MSNIISFDSDVRKGLVLIAVEETLMEIGRKDYERVVTRLKTKYNCYIPDCYLHPEYLEDILEGLYGEYSGQVINQILEKLEKVSNQLLEDEFLTRLSGTHSSSIAKNKKLDISNTS